MDIFLLQVVLWFGMLFLLWVLKDSLGKVESAIDENLGGHATPAFEPIPVVSYSRAEKVMDPIGEFQGAQIFRYARIDGRHYEFEHICHSGQPALLKHQRCLAPGLVYSEC